MLLGVGLLIDLISTGIQIIGLSIFIYGLINFVKRSRQPKLLKDKREDTHSVVSEKVVDDKFETEGRKVRRSRRHNYMFSLIIFSCVGVVIVIFLILYSNIFSSQQTNRAPETTNKIILPNKNEFFEEKNNSSDFFRIQQEKMDACLTATDQWYLYMVNSYCDDYKLKTDCTLPEATVYKWLELKREQRDECISKYK